MVLLAARSICRGPTLDWGADRASIVDAAKSSVATDDNVLNYVRRTVVVADATLVARIYLLITIEVI